MGRQETDISAPESMWCCEEDHVFKNKRKRKMYIVGGNIRAEI